MANSMFVPISKMPSGLGEVRALVQHAFDELSFSTASVRFDRRTPSDSPLMGGFILVDGVGDGNKCWISINSCSPELTGSDDASILVNIQTRGNWVFAGAVAYAFCRFSGRVVFNDACELDGQETYTVDSLRALLLGMPHDSRLSHRD